MKIFRSMGLAVILMGASSGLGGFASGAPVHDAKALSGDLQGGEVVTIMKSTPVLYVESIEPCLAFWMDGLGFKKTAEIKEGNDLGFVILNSGEMEIMLQTYKSLEKDLPNLVKELHGASSVLYIEVKELSGIEKWLSGFPVVVPKRKTFYGATEIFYRSPGGHIIGLSEQEGN